MPLVREHPTLRRIIVAYVIGSCFIIACLLVGMLLGAQQRARYNGGTERVETKAGHKIVSASWKDSNLWILTRPMKLGEVPEVLWLSETSSMGMVEGNVILVEVDSRESARLREAAKLEASKLEAAKGEIE